MSLRPGGLLLESVAEPSAHIHRDFAYVPGFTSVITRLSVVLEHRRGLCQDFSPTWSLTMIWYQGIWTYVAIENTKHCLILAFAVLAFETASCSNAQHPEPKTTGIDHADSSILQAARQVVEAFKAKDGKRLAKLVHPEKGVRFSPSAYVDVESEVVFFRAKVSQFWTDRKTYTWGFADGTGDPINMTPSQYCDRYIMDRDFLHASSISVNNDRARGNTNNNAASVYPQGARVEYYIEPSPGEGVPEFDWAALRLVFERSGGSWFLVAVIRDEWTT